MPILRVWVDLEVSQDLRWGGASATWERLRRYHMSHHAWVSRLHLKTPWTFCNALACATTRFRCSFFASSYDGIECGSCHFRSPYWKIVLLAKPVEIMWLFCKSKDTSVVSAPRMTM